MVKKNLAKGDRIVVAPCRGRGDGKMPPRFSITADGIVPVKRSAATVEPPPATTLDTAAPTRMTRAKKP